MSTEIQSAIKSACVDFMKPIARLLIKNGVGFREFSEICKAAFVDVASNDYGIRGRRTNMSRVAVMTGLSRKDVRRVRDAGKFGSESESLRLRVPETVLSIWHNQPEYLDEHHRPKRIAFDGPGANFRGLVARAGGDIPPRAMLNELLRAGSVVREGAKLRAVSRSYVPEPNDPGAVVLAGSAIKRLVSTLDHNLGCESPEARFFERRVYSDRLPNSQRARFRKLAREKGQLLLNDLSSWLAARETTLSSSPEDAPKATTAGIGVGVFFFDDSTNAHQD
jgi:hypothetical protein